jgi:hypothetical protein
MFRGRHAVIQQFLEVQGFGAVIALQHEVVIVQHLAQL